MVVYSSYNRVNFYDELQSCLRFFTVAFDYSENSLEPKIHLSKVTRLDLLEQHMERIKCFKVWAEPKSQDQDKTTTLRFLGLTFQERSTMFEAEIKVLQSLPNTS